VAVKNHITLNSITSRLEKSRHNQLASKLEQFSQKHLKGTIRSEEKRIPSYAKKYDPPDTKCNLNLTVIRKDRKMGSIQKGSNLIDNCHLKERLAN
jgi:hypothetical protein